MWLLNSSIGRKLIMSISGLFLILFLLFHLCMNVAAVFSGDAYNMICSFLGTNWFVGYIGAGGRRSGSLCVCYHADVAESQGARQ